MSLGAIRNSTGTTFPAQQPHNQHYPATTLHGARIPMAAPGTFVNSTGASFPAAGQPYNPNSSLLGQQMSSTEYNAFDASFANANPAPQREAQQCNRSHVAVYNYGNNYGNINLSQGNDNLAMISNSATGRIGMPLQPQRAIYPVPAQFSNSQWPMAPASMYSGAAPPMAPSIQPRRSAYSAAQYDGSLRSMVPPAAYGAHGMTTGGLGQAPVAPYVSQGRIYPPVGRSAPGISTAQLASPRTVRSRQLPQAGVDEVISLDDEDEKPVSGPRGSSSGVTSPSKEKTELLSPDDGLKAAAAKQADGASDAPSTPKKTAKDLALGILSSSVWYRERMCSKKTRDDLKVQDEKRAEEQGISLRQLQANDAALAAKLTAEQKVKTEAKAKLDRKAAMKAKADGKGGEKGAKTKGDRKEKKKGMGNAYAPVGSEAHERAMSSSKKRKAEDDRVSPWQGGKRVRKSATGNTSSSLSGDGSIPTSPTDELSLEEQVEMLQQGLNEDTSTTLDGAPTAVAVDNAVGNTTVRLMPPSENAATAVKAPEVPAGCELCGKAKRPDNMRCVQCTFAGWGLADKTEPAVDAAAKVIAPAPAPENIAATPVPAPEINAAVEKAEVAGSDEPADDDVDFDELFGEDVVDCGDADGAVASE